MLKAILTRIPQNLLRHSRIGWTR